MKAYKNYMDRIRLDEEQHDKLLEAVRAAEAEKNKNAVPKPAKTRRFPLKTFGLIASAAAVIILAVGVFPGRQTKQADSISTTLINGTGAMVPNGHEAAEMEPAVPQTETSVITEYASLTSAFASADTERLVEEACNLTGVIDFRSVSHDGKKGQIGTAAAPQATAQTSGADRKTAVLTEILELLKTMIPRMQEAGEESGVNGSEDVCRFLIEGKEYLYRSAEGILRAEGREYVLSSSERTEMGKLLNEYFADR